MGSEELKNILLKGSLGGLNSFSKDAWNDENISIYLNSVRDYYRKSSSKFYVPTGLYDNPRVFEFLLDSRLLVLDSHYQYRLELSSYMIKKYSEFLVENNVQMKRTDNFVSSSELLHNILDNNSTRYVGEFNSKAWNDENVLLFKKMLRKQYIRIPKALMNDCEILKICIQNNYQRQLLDFSLNAWNLENIRLLVDSDIKVIPKELYSMSEYLNACLDKGGNINYPMFREDAWNLSNIKKFELLLLNEKIDLSSFPLFLMSNEDVLNFVLVNGLYDYTNLFFVDAFSEDNIALLKKLFKIGYVDFIPTYLKDNKELLNYCLDSGLNELVKDFDYKIWGVSESKKYILSFDDSEVEISLNMAESKDFALSLIMLGHYDEIMCLPIKSTPDEYLDILFETILDKDIYDQVCDKYKSIEGNYLKKNFRNYVIRNRPYIKNIDDIVDIYRNIVYSNSSEIKRLSNEISDLVLSSDDPTGEFKKIEKLFLSPELPNIAKIYGVFRIFHTNESGLLSIDVLENMSPILKRHISYDGAHGVVREIILVSDLLKAFIGSNNISFKRYLEDLKKGSDVLTLVYNGDNVLDEANQKIVDSYMEKLCAIYNQTLEGRVEKYKLKCDFNLDLESLMILYKVKRPDELLDRIVRMFCHFIGLNSYDELINYMSDVISKADQRSRGYENHPFIIEKGDFIKGITDVRFLPKILNNGLVAPEFFGAAASKNGDMTILDTDVSRVDTTTSVKGLFSRNYTAFDYGSTWLVIKAKDKVQVTRDSKGDIDLRYDRDKLEAFYTGLLSEDHYGIRTGLPSSDIDYIITRKYTKEMGFEIARNGFYIPVVDTNGNLLFTSEMYDDIRRQMNGLLYYGNSTFEFSDNLYVEGIESVIEDMNLATEENNYIRQIIFNKIREVLKSFNLEFTDKLDGDLSRNICNFIEIGSTGRGVNYSNSDFDFMLLLDQSIINDRDKFDEIASAIRACFGSRLSYDMNYMNDIRLRNVDLNGVKTDIDISFEGKTDMITYSSDMALKDRVDSMEKSSEEKSLLVKANIVMAKRMLKKAGVYKTSVSLEKEGGLGGAGIENWILGHGGSMVDAFSSFVNAYNIACDMALKDDDLSIFSEFVKIYSVWNFGENFYSIRSDKPLHGDFVKEYMSPQGLRKMAGVLKDYLKSLNMSEDMYKSKTND